MSRCARSLTFMLAICLAFALHATSIAPVRLEQLFAQADQVVLVKVLSGDAEHYKTCMYKATVETAYKGAKAGNTLFSARSARTE